MVRRQFRIVAILATSAFLWACEPPPKPDIEADGPVTDFLRTAATRSQESNNYAAAVNYYQSLYSRDPNDTEALLGLARNLRYLGAAGEAISVMKPGVARHPDRVDLRAELGKAQLAGGLASDAVVTLTEVTEAAPDDWQSLSALGIAHDLLEQFPEAQASYEAALAASPNNVKVLNNLALSMALSGDLEQGITTLEQAAALPRSGVQVSQNLALLYAMRGDIEVAEGLLEQGISEEIAQHNLTFYRQLHSKLAARVGKKPRGKEVAASPTGTGIVSTAIAAEGEVGGAVSEELAGGLMVRLGVFSTEERAQAWMAALRDVHADLFANLRFDIANLGTGDAATGYLLLAGPLSSEALAADFCTKLHSRKEACTIVTR
jgi:Flp pilus assembly protein TadD